MISLPNQSRLVPKLQPQHVTFDPFDDSLSSSMPIFGKVGPEIVQYLWKQCFPFLFVHLGDDFRETYARQLTQLLGHRRFGQNWAWELRGIAKITKMLSAQPPQLLLRALDHLSAVVLQTQISLYCFC